MSAKLFPLALVIYPTQRCLAESGDLTVSINLARINPDIISNLGIVCALIGATLVFEVKSSI
jgi:hypothetical protein